MKKSSLKNKKSRKKEASGDGRSFVKGFCQLEWNRFICSGAWVIRVTSNWHSASFSPAEDSTFTPKLVLIYQDYLGAANQVETGESRMFLIKQIRGRLPSGEDSLSQL